MKAVSAHVQNGQIVLDEPVELPEGAAVEVLVPTDNELTVDERAALDAALAESSEEVARGEYEDARAFAHKLVRGS
ncbi:MAG TPA: hypothetical protein VM513_01265 [Kofleriaceae bacterium]|jgi:hypothetical protein|nr:hypothetical protein [Kofleriaceae bacterium]